ncbi:MAG: anthranilate synthase component I family protein [Bacteroidota bacterium]|nr:anthranilate synthase component I family protein [Bacteroidota bacterium]
MKREFFLFHITDFNNFKNQLLSFEKKFSNFCFLDNHEYHFNKSYECVAGAGSINIIKHNTVGSLLQLQTFQKENKDWIFGHVSYDLKNEIEDLFSKNFDGIQFPDFFFFVPEIVFILSKDAVSIGVYDDNNAKEIFNEISKIIVSEKKYETPLLRNRFSHKEYLQSVKKFQEHISRGDCYEICFCQEFFAENIQLDPVTVFKKLSDFSPNPFSAFYKCEEKYLMCASPERFLKKIGNTIISQPIKGTLKRTGSNNKKDKEEKTLLQTNEKERAENTIIVDLVRNDLSKICIEGSVTVKEFLEIYSFPQVHQMISTITGSLNDNISFAEILTATFPMGSMTGAPKKRVMELIEKYERTKRGLFSGTVGYINPEGDFDFNVVIRSILYNKKNKYLSIQSGSAITFKSDPDKEYEECKVKIEAMRQALM